MLDEPSGKGESEAQESPTKEKQAHLCDRCGFEMIGRNCKIICPNCGNRFDCSDLSIYLDERTESRE